MEFWIVLAAAVALLLLIPHVRWLCKRIALAVRLRRACRARQLTLHAAHSLWFLGGRRSVGCDVYIETPTQVFAVKLFGMRRRLSVLIFCEDGTYIVRRFIAMISQFGASVRFPLDARPRRLPAYDFRVGYREAWEIKTPRHILLIHPVCMEIRRRPDRSGEVILGAGDIVGGMELSTLTRLLGELECAS